MGGSQQKFLSFLLPTRQSPSHLYDYSGIEDGGYLLEMTPLKITANTDCLLCFGGNAATLYELIPI